MRCCRCGKEDFDTLFLVDGFTREQIKKGMLNADQVNDLRKPYCEDCCDCANCRVAKENPS
jgi:hypothetical protein